MINWMIITGLSAVLNWLSADLGDFRRLVRTRHHHLPISRVELARKQKSNGAEYKATFYSTRPKTSIYPHRISFSSEHFVIVDHIHPKSLSNS
jgi:hypothetical protein